MKLLLIQGANMASLGRRQPTLYGTTTARELDAVLLRQAAELGVELDIFYTSNEGEAVDRIHQADDAGIDVSCSIQRASCAPAMGCATA